MIGWLKSRLLRERRKLASQTYRAATDLEVPLKALMMDGIVIKHFYNEAEKSSVSLAEALASGKKINEDLIESTLNVNKNMRRLYDVYGRKDRGSFDAAYAPLGGWKMYFEDHTTSECELTYINDMRNLAEDQW